MTDSLILFDVDGTLVDGAAQICGAMRFAFLSAGAPEPDPASIIAMIGLSLPMMVEVLTPGGDEELRAKIIASYRLRFFNMLDSEEEPPIFPGAETALRQLHRAGITLGLATGKSRRGVEHVLEAMDWHAYFATVQLADDNPSKPDPTMIHRALSETGVSPENAALVGDTVFDMQMAQAAGVRPIGVDWGYQPAARLYAAGAERVFSDFEALADYMIETKR
ncbi:HAD family hydrolase [Jannaschia marina]|uniref:HAD family hydrolase n=1 Tax=Jannaschia marina TaxID=2741674 RepID=UPI0015C98947|nr:HAD-IA family hydrolase [Jannaschia marina]